MTDLGAFAGVVEQAAEAAIQSAERLGADVGQVVGTPPEDMTGVQMAWEAFRGYMNTGAGVHHNALVRAADQLRRLG